MGVPVAIDVLRCDGADACLLVVVRGHGNGSGRKIDRAEDVPHTFTRKDVAIGCAKVVSLWVLQVWITKYDAQGIAVIADIEQVGHVGGGDAGVEIDFEHLL